MVPYHDRDYSSLSLLERKLCEMEQKRNEEKSLWKRLETVRQVTYKIWQPVRLRWFTDHGPAHSDRVARLIGQIVRPLYDDFEAPFSRYELYVLLVACYLHDIGMQDLRIDGKSSNELGPNDYEEIRRRHPERSAEIIIKQTLNLEGQDFSLELGRDQILRAIALVCKAHGTDFFDEAMASLTLPITPDVDETVRGSALAALLMMGDELDLHQNRVTHLFSPYATRFEEFPPVSLLHIYKHHYITNVQVADGDINRRRCIKLSFTFPRDSDQYAELLRLWVEKKLVEQCEKTQEYIRSLGLLWAPSISVEWGVDDSNIYSSLPNEARLCLQEQFKGLVQAPALPPPTSPLSPTERDYPSARVLAEEKDPVVRWLERLKFSTIHPFPFKSERAEFDPLLRDCFLSFPSFDELVLDRHVIICGKTGSGKTSCRKRFLDGVDAGRVFVVKVTDFHEVAAQISGAGLNHESPAQIDASRLRQILIAHFNDSEFRSLCFDLGVDYDSLRGESKDDKARELVAYLERRGRVAELVKVCYRLRPNAAWQEAIPRQLLDECQSASPTASSSLVLLARHIHQILKSGASELFKLVCQKKRFAETYCGLSEIRQNRLLRYLHDYVESGDRQKLLDDGLVNRGLPSVGELRIHGSKEQDALIQFAASVLTLDKDTSGLPRLTSNPSSLLNDFREILGWFGYEKVVVIYDNLDGFGESPDAVSRLLAPLLNARILFDSLENIYFKFFLPVGLGDTLAGCWAVQSGSIQWLPELAWKPKQLKELYRLRLRAATNGRYDGLTPVAEPSFSDVDDRLIKEASTPRDLLRLGRLLLEAHLQSSDAEEHLLSEGDLTDALGKFTNFCLGKPPV